MSLKDALWQHLLDDVRVVAACGTNVTLDPPSPDIYRESIAPTSAGFPRITLQVISGEDVNHMLAASGRIRVLIQVNVWAENDVDVETLQDAVRSSLHGFPRGTMGSGSNTIEVQSCFLQSHPIEQYEPPTAKNQTGVFERVMEFQIWHTASVPVFT